MHLANVYLLLVVLSIVQCYAKKVVPHGSETKKVVAHAPGAKKAMDWDKGYDNDDDDDDDDDDDEGDDGKVGKWGGNGWDDKWESRLEYWRTHSRSPEETVISFSTNVSVTYEVDTVTNIEGVPTTIHETKIWTASILTEIHVPGDLLIAPTTETTTTTTTTSITSTSVESTTDISTNISMLVTTELSMTSTTSTLPTKPVASYAEVGCMSYPSTYGVGASDTFDTFFANKGPMTPQICYTQCKQSANYDGTTPFQFGIRGKSGFKVANNGYYLYGELCICFKTAPTTTATNCYEGPNGMMYGAGSYELILSFDHSVYLYKGDP